MGRAARTKHERRQVARWAQAADLAQRADQAADHVIAHCLAQAFGARARSTSTPSDVAGPGGAAHSLAELSWLPNSIFVEDLLATNGVDIDQTDDAELEKYCRLAAAMTTVINWLPGRTVVYYDATAARVPGQHAIEEPIPAQALYGCPRGGSTWTCRGLPEAPASSRA